MNSDRHPLHFQDIPLQKSELPPNHLHAKSFNPSLIKSAKINLSNMILAIGSFHQNRLSINLLKSQNLIPFHQKR